MEEPTVTLLKVPLNGRDLQKVICHSGQGVMFPEIS